MEITDTGTGTGECFYLGCNNDGCQFHDGLVEYNYCHGTLSATAGHGDAVDLKSGSYSNIIRHNIFVDLRGPGILVYDSKGRGNNIIDGNFILRSGDNGIQATNGAIIRNNIVVDSNGGIAGAANQGTPGNLNVRHNTVVNSGANGCFRGNSFNLGSAFTVANNAFYCEGQTAVIVLSGSENVEWSNNAYRGTINTNTNINSGIFLAGTLEDDFVNSQNHNYYPTKSRYVGYKLRMQICYAFGYTVSLSLSVCVCVCVCVCV